MRINLYEKHRSNLFRIVLVDDGASQIYQRQTFRNNSNQINNLQLKNIKLVVVLSGIDVDFGDFFDIIINIQHSLQQISIP
jgi:hypothetical protein